jgi:hypothetical protein
VPDPQKFADPCHPGCKGWDIFNAGQEFAGGEVQACDDCREAARAAGQPARYLHNAINPGARRVNAVMHASRGAA